jgi:DNA-binding XRE family transcriptional regulator
MMAYLEDYIDYASNNLGEMFDYAVNDCGISGDVFLHDFIVCGIADRFGNGEHKYLLGKTGVETAMEVLSRTEPIEELPEPRRVEHRTAEYWGGWAIAQYQWKTGKPFREIFRDITFEDLLKLYILHEADISKFYSVVDSLCEQRKPEKTKLGFYRKQNDLSQSELAEKSGVSLRSIQMYEQGNKDINKASVESVLKLARALNCKVEDLLEYRLEL